MEGKEEDVKLGANKFSERQAIGTAAQQDKDHKEAPPAPLFEPEEVLSWSFYRAGIAEFVATFLYVSVLTVMGWPGPATGSLFAFVYCTAGISGNFYLSNSCKFLHRSSSPKFAVLEQVAISTLP